MANYDVRQNGAGANQLAATGAAPDDVVELQADGKSVIISLDESADLAKNASVTVKVSGVKTEDLKNTVADSTTTFLASDADAPTATTAKVNATANGFVVTYSEPVDFTSAVAKVDGVPATLTAGPDKYSVNVAATLTAGQTYSVYVSGIKDLAGNSSAAVTKSVTHTADTVAPALQSVTQSGDTTLKFKFSEKIAAGAALPTVTVSRGTTIFAQAQPTLDTTDATQTTYTLALTTPVGAVDLYPAGQSSTSVVVDVASFKDLAGNVASGSTQNVTLARSTTVPAVVETKWDPANTAVVAKFDKTLATALTAGKLLVTDETGADVTASITAAVDVDGVVGAPGSGKYIVFTGVTANHTYTFNLLAGYTKDTAVVPNFNAAYTFSVTTSGTNDVTAPVIETDAAGGAGTVDELAGVSANGTKVTPSANGNVIEVLFSEEVAASAASASNFKLDGAALPAGTVVTLGKGAVSTTKNLVAKITLPATAVAFDGNYELTVSGIKDAAGNTMTPATVVVGLNDTVAPEVKTAKVNADNTVTITASEAIKSSTLTGSEADFIVTVNSVRLANTEFTVVDDATANDKAFKFTFTGVNVVGQTVNVATADTTAAVTDNSTVGNLLKGGTSVVATN